jgi:hypothetical protein
MGEIRDAIVSAALEVADYRAACDEESFRELLGPAPRGDTWDLSVPFSCKRVGDKYVTRGVSTCGLVSAAILRRSGIVLPWDGAAYWDYPPPYHGLDVVSALSKLGLESGARKTGRPEAGDIVCIGSSLSTHVFCCIGWEGDVCVSVDGGQVDDAAHRHLQRVRVCRRAWPRPVVWVIDAVSLAAWCAAREAYP